MEQEAAERVSGQAALDAGRAVYIALHGAQVGNSQMYDEKAMDEALRRCMKLGYATIPEFMIYSGLKRDSAKAYLDSLCKGDKPRLWKVRESRRWLYFPKKDTTKE